jgi:hypothetical protein
MAGIHPESGWDELTKELLKSYELPGEVILI